MLLQLLGSLLGLLLAVLPFAAVLFVHHLGFPWFVSAGVGLTLLVAVAVGAAGEPCGDA